MTSVTRERVLLSLVTGQLFFDKLFARQGTGQGSRQPVHGISASKPFNGKRCCFPATDTQSGDAAFETMLL